MADLITSSEAARLSGFHVNHIRRLIRTGAIRARKFGEVWQIDRRSLLAYVRNAEKSPDRRRGAKRRS